MWVTQGFQVRGIIGTYTLSVIYLGANGASEADTDFPEGIEGLSTSGRGRGRRLGHGEHQFVRSTPTGSAWSYLEAGKTYQIDIEGQATGRGTLADPYIR